jgi:hypothetical protein
MKIVEGLLPSVVVLVAFVFALRAIVRATNDRPDDRRKRRPKP